MSKNNWPYNTSRWRKLRRAKLMRSPLCEHCSMLSRVVPALIVDHIKAIRNGGLPFPPLDGLQSLCQVCHNRKTASDVKDIEHLAIGFDAQGNPIDPNHPWHRGGNKDEISNAHKPAVYKRTYLVSNPNDDDEAFTWV